MVGLSSESAVLARPSVGKGLRVSTMASVRAVLLQEEGMAMLWVAVGEREGA